MIKLSDQQLNVVEADFSPMAVTACAGSGKTATAVRRLVEMRGRLKDRHGIIALLSFSNVAVDTFNRDYLALTRSSKIAHSSYGVEIDTVDGFITTNVLRPHGYLAMGCGGCPYLVDGREPFLKGFSVWDGTRPQPTAGIRVGIAGGQFRFEVGRNTKLNEGEATKAIHKLGQVGAYTHALARYWVLKVLKEHPFVLKALVRRYPHVLVDEAQDIGTEHEAILRLMVGGGSQLSLIGDTNQGIYEFSGADGSFLAGYEKSAGVTGKRLATNFRSVPAIVSIANALSRQNDKADRTAPTTMSGAYFMPYKQAEKDKTLANFVSMLTKAGIDPSNAAVLCRSSEWAGEWNGGVEAQGQGVVKAFAEAAIQRDKLGRFDEAFKHGCAAIVGLLNHKHRDLVSQLLRPANDGALQGARRRLWQFIKDSGVGIPSATLIADTEWHPLLVTRAKAFIEELAKEFGMEPGDNLGNKLAKRDLLNRALIEVPDLAASKLPDLRVSTVHKVKGESIQGVMYVCNKKHVQELIAGTGTEVGRIGYVALTRARDLFVLAVPHNSISELEPTLTAIGFQKIALG